MYESMKFFFSIRCFNAIAALVFICISSARAQENDPFVKMDDPALTGRWDWKVTDGDAHIPGFTAQELQQMLDLCCKDLFYLLVYVYSLCGNPFSVSSL